MEKKGKLIMGTGRPPGNYNPHDDKGHFTKGKQYYDIRMGEGFKDTSYGFKDTTVTHKHTEYVNDKELLKAREEYLKDKQIARNKAEAEQRAFDESIKWAKENLTPEEKDLYKDIKKAEDALKFNPNNKQIQEFYTKHKNTLQAKLNASISKRALEHRKQR